jgi:adenylate cyclase
MARLILATAEGQQAIELRSNNSLGRHPSNSIQLLDKIVSKEHCTLEQQGGRFVLRDLGSLNGTYVNGERLRADVVLRHGDEIALGSTRARFDDGSSALPPPPIGPGAVQANPDAPFNATPIARTPAPSAPQITPQRPESRPVEAPRGAMAPSAARQPYPSPTTGTLALPRSRPVPRGTRVDVRDAAHSIGTQIAAQAKGFSPFDLVGRDPQQLGLDYERLRITWELTRDIGLERDLDRLLDKILLALFKFTKADRGVILMREDDGSLQPRAARRRDGSDASIEVSSTILNHVIRERASVLTHDASMDFASSSGKSMILNRISSAMVVPLVHDNEKDVLGVLWLDSETLAQFLPRDLEVITSVAGQASMFIENTILARKVEQEIVLRDRFARLVAPNVAEQMMSGKLEVTKGGQLIQELTVYNSDIRGFTRMSEGTPAEVIVEMLNEYFEQMVETLFKYEGTLDKFMGDGIMAFWGAPLAHPDDPIRSVECALDQMAVLGHFNRERIGAGKPALAVGIGIHSGPGVVGYVGSSKALSYTVIGDTANTSSRLCSSALAGQIVISEATAQRVASRFELEEIEARSLKGKEIPMRRFNVLRAKSHSVASSG